MTIYLRSRAYRIFLLLAATAVLLGVACQPAKQAGPQEKVTLAYSMSYNAVLAHVALAKGFFAEEGLAVTASPQAFGKKALDEVLEGKADLATVADTPFVFAAMDGRKITILATIETSHRNNAVVARTDRSIAKPTDLKGKKIGVTRGTTVDFFTHIFLEAHGLGGKDVTLVDLKPEEMKVALASGKIDAAATWNPVLTELRQALGEKGVSFYGESLYTETFCLVAGRDFVGKHPEAVRRVLRGLIRAEEFMRDHPAEARRLVAVFTKTDQAILDGVWDILTFRVDLAQSLIVDLEDQARWAIKNGLTKGRTMPNFIEYIYSDGLKAVKPEAVRIIR